MARPKFKKNFIAGNNFKRIKEHPKFRLSNRALEKTSRWKDSELPGRNSFGPWLNDGYLPEEHIDKVASYLNIHPDSLKKKLNKANIDEIVKKLMKPLDSSPVSAPSSKFWKSVFRKPEIDREENCKSKIFALYRISARELDQVNPSNSVTKKVRNSFRYRFIGDNGKKYFFREILRRQITIQLSKYKYDLLSWIHAQGNINIPLMIDQKGDKDFKYELYNYIEEDEHNKDISVDKLAELLVNIALLSNKLAQENNSLLLKLSDKRDQLFHQFDYLAGGKKKYFKINHINELKQIMSNRARSDNADTEVYDLIRDILNSIEAHIKSFDEFLKLFISYKDLAPRIIHGDINYTNMFISNNKLYLFDWDSVRISKRYSYFDIAYVVARASNTSCPLCNNLLTFNEKLNENNIARELLKKYENQCVNNDIEYPSDQILNDSFRIIEYEYVFRMLEYLTILSYDSHHIVQKEYLMKCNPDTVKKLRKKLFPDLA